MKKLLLAVALLATTQSNAMFKKALSRFAPFAYQTVRVTPKPVISKAVQHINKPTEKQMLAALKARGIGMPSFVEESYNVYCAGKGQRRFYSVSLYKQVGELIEGLKDSSKMEKRMEAVKEKEKAFKDFLQKMKDKTARLEESIKNK
jgi:DNA topoisomerase IA